jgi:hypothetical protein
MPGADRLPESIRPLAEMNALQVRRDPDYHTDMMRLIQTMERQIIGSAQASPEAAKYAPKDTISRHTSSWGWSPSRFCSSAAWWLGQASFCPC